ncbi:hypothetical protein HYV81_03625 [Candidatus Woesearchaeota archaeon]|nr:hypothetical protein [Candidatus Woesearchaeota archaeon]
MKQKISITLDEHAIKEIDSTVDNIYIRNRSQAIEHLVKTALGENKTAVILAGGPEEQLKTKGEFCFSLPVRGSSLIEGMVKKFREHRFKAIYVIGRHAVITRIFELLKDGSSYGVKITYIEEKHSKGTADSLRLLKGKVSGTFLTVYCDIYFNRINLDEVWKDHLKQGSLCTLMLTTSSKPSEKGTVIVEGTKILQFIQKPKQSDIYLVFSPIFAAEPEIFDYPGTSLEQDVFPALAEKGLLYGHMSSEKEIHVRSREEAGRVR